MGCLSNRKKQTHEFVDQKWDHINLQDFKAKGCGAGFGYGYLWFSLILSAVVYCVDCFTAVNLLFYHKQSSKIVPAIPPDISKWIFSGCIILSVINLAYEYIRAIRVMKRGNVAESYLDTLAARWQAARIGEGQGWRRFLVFAELTKSKKGAEYVALFTYFAFQSWIRVLLCSGPRQVVNAITLKAVYQGRLSPDAKDSDVGGAFLSFFDKVRKLAEEDYQQAATLSGMCFTFVVWVFSALTLLTAVCFYIFFLFHWIPRADGGLSAYCERKVNKKLLKIVTHKVTKALAKGQANRMKAEYKAARLNGEKPQLERAATLPTLPNVEPLPVKEDSLPAMPALNRTETMNTLPQYQSRPGSPGSIELRSMDQRRPPNARAGTSASNASFSSRAPLMADAADMGYEPGYEPDLPAPTLPNLELTAVPPLRPGTSNSQRSYGPPRPGTAPPTNQMNPNAAYRNPTGPNPPPMDRPGGGRYANDNVNPYGGPITQSPAPMDSSQFPAPSRTPVGRGMDGYGPPPGQGNYAAPSASSGSQYAPYNPDGRTSPALSTSSRPQYAPYNPDGRSSPAPSVSSSVRGPPVPRQQTPMGQPPARSATGQSPPRGPQYPPQRNMTAPIQPQASGGEYFDRSATPQGTRGPPQGPGGDYTDRSGTPQRSATPQGMRGPPQGPGGDYFNQAATPQRLGTPQSTRGPPQGPGRDYPDRSGMAQRSATPQSTRGPPQGPGGEYFDRSATPQGTRGPSTQRNLTGPAMPPNQRTMPYGYDAESQRGGGGRYQ